MTEHQHRRHRRYRDVDPAHPQPPRDIDHRAAGAAARTRRRPRSCPVTSAKLLPDHRAESAAKLDDHTPTVRARSSGWNAA
ncbi:hypothetical protein E1293_41485 [Actinomadura darangshiensis]|uniref:Uncharacterized protein n=1 Tax=Actinomadura darangshiensis TaxID=705336 RepID=A0A4R5A165_9ACTN|nr:hypothetical protein [Actinomadura darangshiensis]TDD64476.1 hypothetical protein E1293_41485 [Actinomadura darangshiensis]